MPATRVGSAYVTIESRSEQFLRASEANVQAIRRQRQAMRTLQRTTRRINSTLSSFTRQIAVIGSAAVLGGLSISLAGAARESAQLGAALRENSVRYGLTVTQLQELQRTLEGNGASQREFETGFRSFNRALVEAGDGVATYRDAFDRLGIDLDRLARDNVSNYDAFLLTADALAQIEDPAQRVAISMDLFSRSGTALLPTLIEGSAAIREQASAFGELGLVTGEQADTLKALEQSYTDTQNIIETSIARIVADNAELFFSFNQFSQTTLPAVFEGFISIIQTLRENSRTLVVVLQTLAAAFAIRQTLRAYSLAMAAITVATNAAAAATNIFAASLRVLRNALIASGIGAAVVILGEALARVLGHLLDLNAAVTEVVGTSQAAAQRLADIEAANVAAIANERREITLLQQELETLPSSRESERRSIVEQIRDRRDSITELEEEIRLLRARRAAAEAAASRSGAPGTTAPPPLPPPQVFTPITRPGSSSAVDQYTRDLEEALATLREIGLESRAVQRSYQIVNDAVRAAAGGSAEEMLRIYRENFLEIAQLAADTAGRIDQSLSSGYRASVESTLQLRDSLTDAYSQAIDGAAQLGTTLITDFRNAEDAAKQLARTIINQLLNALIRASIQQALLSAGVPIPGLQRGGIGSGLTIVGERGPEIVDFETPSRVYSNDDLANALGRGGQGQFVFAPVIQTSDADAVRLALAEAYPIFERQITQRIQSDAQRPSAMQRSLR